MMRTIAIGLGLAAAAAMALPAAADGWRGSGWGGGHGWGGHGWDHHHYRRHDGGSVFFSFPVTPRYVYPDRQVVVIERPPVVVQAPPAGVALGREVDNGSGRYCREYQTTGRIAGKVEQLWGVACLQPDGSWELAG
jgi:hypothetical protein